MEGPPLSSPSCPKEKRLPVCIVFNLKIEYEGISTGFVIWPLGLSLVLVEAHEMFYHIKCLST